MKASKVAIWLLLVAFYGTGQSQTSAPPPLEIFQEASRFVNGHPLNFRGRVKIAWQECYLFVGDIGSIYVDTQTKQVTAVFYKLSTSNGEKLTQEEAFKKVKSWLIERKVNLDSWILEEQKTYDRGSAGKEYVFRWVKCSSEGIILPCILKVVISEDGVIRSFWRIEREVVIPLKSFIKAEKAIEIAIQASGFAQGKVKIMKKQLRVWFNDKGQQCLLYEIMLQKEDKLWRQVILNAHSGEVMAILQPLVKVPFMRILGKDTNMKIKEILRDLQKITKIEIIAHKSFIGIPLASPTKGAHAVTIGIIDIKNNQKILQSLLKEIEIMLKQPKPFAALVATPFWLRLYSRDNRWIYHCKFSPKDSYFEIYTKEPWPQKLEGKVVKIIREKNSIIYIYDWPPEEAVKINISCNATHRFKDIIMSVIKKKKHQ